MKLTKVVFYLGLASWGLVALSACPGGSDSVSTTTDAGSGSGGAAPATGSGGSVMGVGGTMMIGSGGTMMIGSGGTMIVGRGGSSGADAAVPGGMGGATAASTKYGLVALNSLSIGPASIYSSSASFHDGVADSSACTNRTVGACQIIRCPVTDAGAPVTGMGGAPGSAPHVGVISITGGVSPVTLTPGANGIYMGVSGAGAIWTPTSRIRFSAAGGTIPAFPATELVPPMLISELKLNGASILAAPMRNVAGRGSLVMTWTGGSGTIGFILGQRSSTSILSMPCRTDVASGTFTFPAAVTAELTVGEGSMSVTQLTQQNVMAGEYSVGLSLGANPPQNLVALTLN